MKNSALVFIAILFISCNNLSGIDDLETNEIASNTQLKKVPTLLNVDDYNAIYETTNMTYVQNRFVGIGNINNSTMKISEEEASWDFNMFGENFVDRNDKKFEVYIDTTQLLTIHEYQIPDDFWENLSFESLLIDIESEMEKYPLLKYKSYPVFVINRSEFANSILLEDGRIAMIYEAKNEDGLWKPIEYKTYSWCGNSYYNYTLNPDDFALLKVPVHSGSFKTKLRLKLRMQESIFYSNEISGYIDKFQVNFENIESEFSWIHYDQSESDYRSLFLDE